MDYLLFALSSQRILQAGIEAFLVTYLLDFLYLLVWLYFSTVHGYVIL